MASPQLPVRPREGRVLGGVCAALSARFGMDVTLIRLAFLLLSLAKGFGLLVYGAAWLLLPLEGSRAGTPGRIVRENLDRAGNAFSQVGSRAQRAWSDTRTSSWPRPLDRRWIAVVLVGLGSLSLLWSFGLFSWITAPRLFGLALVTAGIGALVTLNAPESRGRGRR